MNSELWWKDFFRGPWEQVQLPGYPEQRTSAEVAFMIDAPQLRSGARVLDISCGEGRHVIELAQRGFDVTGIDFNENAIAVAMQHATETKLEVSFIVGDMRELAPVEEYDAVICFLAASAISATMTISNSYDVSPARCDPEGARRTRLDWR